MNREVVSYALGSLDAVVKGSEKLGLSAHAQQLREGIAAIEALIGDGKPESVPVCCECGNRCDLRYGANNYRCTCSLIVTDPQSDRV